MKAVLIALALFAANNAFAAKDCTPYLDSTKSGGEGGGSNVEWTYPCGKNYKVNHRACNEGEVSYDSVMDPSGNFWMQVPVVCHNGTFHAPAAPVKHRGCNEGEVSYTNDLDPSGNFYQSVTLVCKNGRFVRR